MDVTMLEQSDGPQFMPEQVKGVKNKEQQKERGAADQSPGPPATSLKGPNPTSGWGKERCVDEGEEFALTFCLSSLFLTTVISD